jgi:hypothetical protein
MNDDKKDTPPLALRPLLYLYLRLRALAATIKRKINAAIDWLLDKIVTILIMYYMRAQEAQAQAPAPA